MYGVFNGVLWFKSMLCYVKCNDKLMSIKQHNCRTEGRCAVGWRRGPEEQPGETTGNAGGRRRTAAGAWARRAAGTWAGPARKGKREASLRPIGLKKERERKMDWLDSAQVGFGNLKAICISGISNSNFKFV